MRLRRRNRGYVQLSIGPALQAGRLAQLLLGEEQEPSAAFRHSRGTGREGSMYCVSVKAARRLRGGIVSLAAIVSLLAVSADPADARGKRKRVSARSQQAAAVVKKPANITAD